MNNIVKLSTQLTSRCELENIWKKKQKQSTGYDNLYNLVLLEDS